jgi:signal transduction histidine kinase
MKAFFRAFCPDRLASQIALLVLAAIVLFHLAVTASIYLTGGEPRRPLVEPRELLAGAIWSIDAAEVSERAAVVSALGKAAPWLKFSLAERPPEGILQGEDGDLGGFEATLWPGAKPFAFVAAADRKPIDLGVALRKGGYVLATTTPSFWSRHGAIWAARREPGSFFLHLVERSALFFLLCATILTIWISNTVVSPLVRLVHEAERFPDESCKRQLLPEAGSTEVRELARALNRMQGRIKAMIEARSHALAAISHDLRTIITRIRLRSEFITDEALKSKMLHDADLMDSMLYKNLQHLRDANRQPERGLIDLDSVLQTVCDQYADLGHDVVYRGGEHQIISGSITEIQRIFSNLVENAVAHAGRVVVCLDQPCPNIIHVDVEDDGPGIAAHVKNRVLEPFVRGEPARNMNQKVGFGLGLSIVRSLVEDLGGNLELRDREPNGLIARVSLPRAYAGSETAL